jgi:hypothetical protein
MLLWQDVKSLKTQGVITCGDFIKGQYLAYSSFYDVEGNILFVKLVRKPVNLKPNINDLVLMMV